MDKKKPAQMEGLEPILHGIFSQDSKDNDLKRENANINCDSSMGTMLKIGSETSKAYYLDHMLKKEHARLHQEGWIHLHDLDFYGLTMTCVQIDLTKLFAGGFNTGHGTLREPNSIMAYSSLACIALQCNQNEMHGGQAIANFDRDMAPGVAKTYRKEFIAALKILCEDRLSLDLGDISDEDDQSCEQVVKSTLAFAEEIAKKKIGLAEDSVLDSVLVGNIASMQEDSSVPIAKQIVALARNRAWKATNKLTHQAMEAFIHNLNTLHSRAGSQVPFSSVNYGTDTSPEGRMVVKNLLLATEEGLGSGETPIFPIQIFKVKRGVNLDPTDVNYDLFMEALRCTAKRMFPNFSFLDAPFNAQFYKEGHPETEIAYMGCRTRTISNAYDGTKEQVTGRGNLSFTSINLPRLAIEAHGDQDKFFSSLDEILNSVADQLLERLEVQSRRHVFNFPFLMGEGIWLDSEKLQWNDEVREVIKHGSLSIGFIGLAECLVALIGKHHGESEEAQALGLKIIGHMREFTDKKNEELGLNFGIIGTPAEGLSGRFVKIDKEKYGVIPGVTDRDYYTNSSHVPVYYPISIYDKLHIEAPYHALENAGHIAYVEMDGDVSQNIPAMETVIRTMADSGVGYGAINHPLDRDPECGFNGIINDECPCCHRKESEGHPFERIRRITGYLVGTLDRFNNAKKAEVKDRVKHSYGSFN